MSIDFQDNLYRDAKISRCRPAHIPKGIKNTQHGYLKRFEVIKYNIFIII